MCCVDLLLEGRCSLDVSFAAYKYLLIYGEVLAFIGLIQYYFVANMSQATWYFLIYDRILIDGSTVPISWALTLARPAARLIPTRPTARLLGAETILSVVGPIFIHVVFALISVGLLYRQSFFLCHEFDGTNADLRRWWELGDSYEAATTSIMVMFQIIHSAAAFNWAHKYRQGGLQNRIFVGLYLFFFGVISIVLLGDPNALGCQFRINCGTPTALSSLGYSVPFNAPEVYYTVSGHNVFPHSFRVTIFALSIMNLVAGILWEQVVILGPIREWARRKWGAKKEFLQL